MGNVPLSTHFHITERFHRSVHLERDFYTENALDGYVVTVKARETLTRLISAQEIETTSKAWSLTGPYGSGKSSFALFAAKLFGATDLATTQHALNLLKRGDTALYERFRSINGNGKSSSSGFCSVLISGERSSLPIALLQGLEYGLQNFGIPYSNSLRQKIRKVLKTAANNTPPQATEITNLFESATRSIEKNGGQGLLLVIDELGKFLEYAAQHPARGDVFVLQTLAEFATRSDNTPLFLLTILHQAFEQYANKIAKSQREEWAKIQGRFEDIAFVEPTEEVLRLVGTAIKKRSKIHYKNNLHTAIGLGLKPRQLDEKEFIQLLENCLPLHPTVALIIGSIFRRFAQNERSLFAFLSSSEPHGLQDFLLNQSYNGHALPMLSIADLYDYLNATVGNRLYASHNGKQWAEIGSAVDRFSDPYALSVKLIKAIGLLGIIGEVVPNLKASADLLRFMLDDNTEDFAGEFKTALATLEKRSITTYRSYNDAYALWEGSDIDIEEKLREAENRVDTKGTLGAELARYMPTRPLVARRHLFKTGTLRYFTVRYTGIENFDADLKEPLGDADGLVLYVLPENEDELAQLIEKAHDIHTKNRKEGLIAIPRSVGFLRDAVMQLAYLHWIVENTPKLEGDVVARRELAGRRIEAERDVSDRLEAIFGGDSEESCRWYHQGQEISIDSQRARNEYLSEICDEVYDKTPIIRNELINRRKISGAATTARKKLIRAMLENGDRKNLAITGYPAEMSIYRSLLWNTGIHSEFAGVRGFHPPKPDDTNNIKYTWKAIEDFLETCEGERKPVIQLYECLIAPPFGVHQGPLPILLCAVMEHYKTEIALYENGSFIADWSMPVFERLLKAPQLFELKRFRIVGIRADLFAQLLQMLNQPVETEKSDLLTVVTPLMRFISQLPRYTLVTQELSDEAKNIRKAVLNAREPDELLFKQLPEALGFHAFGPEISIDTNLVSDFFNTLQDALSQLRYAYDNLLNWIEQMLARAFALTPTKKELREELVARAEQLQDVAIELKGFLTQVCSDRHDSIRWLEAIATNLAQKPPTSWTDIDKTQFEINLSQLARKFRHFEAITYEKWEHTESPTGEPIRIGITRPKQPEQEQVVILPSSAEKQAEKLERAIEQTFDDIDTDGNHELRLAVLGRISQRLMQQQEE